MPSDAAALWLTVVTVSLHDDDELARTVASVDDQSRDGVEHVVVLGEPPHYRTDTGDARARRRIVVMPPSGVYAAMNRGLHAATGTLIHFLNAGDEYATDDVISRVRARYEREAFSWAFGRMLVSRSAGDPGRVRGVTWADMQAHHFRGMHFPEHPTVFARTDLLVQLGGFDTSYRTAADYRLLLQLATEYPGVDLDLVVARYSLGGVSDTKWVGSVRECFRARMEYLKPTGLAAVRERLHMGAALANQGIRRLAGAAVGVRGGGPTKAAP